MIKSSTRIWVFIYLIISFIIGTLILTNGQHNTAPSVTSILLSESLVVLFTFGIPIWLSTRLKTIIIDNNGIRIIFPFLKRNSFYAYSSIDHFITYEGIARGFSFQELKIVLKNKKTLTISSAVNTRFEKMDIFLQQKIEKKSI